MSESDASLATVSLKSDPSLVLNFEAMVVTEELGRPFLIDLDVSTDKPKTDLVSLLGGSVTVTLKTSATSKPTYYNGILARMVYKGLSAASYRYKLELRPWIWLLSRVQNCVIYQDKSAWTIIKGMVQAAGFSDAMSDRRRNASGSDVLEYCVQYCETSFDFITRLMEQFGLYYYFEHTNDKHTLVVADDANSHPAAVSIPYQAQTTDIRKTFDHIWEWSADARLQPGAFAYRDYNFELPSADLTARSTMPGNHTYGTNEIYDYPGLYKVVGNGTKLADVRMQDIAARRQIMGGTTNSRSIYAGARFTLTKLPGATSEDTFIVVGATGAFGGSESRSSEEGELTDSFRCSFTAISETLSYRMDRRTKRPIIPGPQTARVVGESGQEITTDKYGRVKLKFFWDRSAVNNQESSCWIRVSQSWAGNQWGGMQIPRIGQEVIVEFLDGNPDRPLITGQVYNGNNGVPYPLPDNKTRSTLKSRSSQGGGGFNELRFEDKKDSEEVFFQAQKDYNKVVLHNETVTITQDTTTTVKQGNRAVTVSQGNDTTTVSTGNHKLTVSTGNHDIEVSAGTSTIQAAQSITLQVGASSIKIEPAQITLSSPQITVQATGPLSAQGATVSVQADATCSVQAGAELTLAGATVMIN
jgi:type VI secretion system secreted protein VgrG